MIDHTRMDRVRVSCAVIRLSDKRLIVREANPSDQRAQMLDLCPAGMDIYRQIVPLARSMQLALSEALTAAERKQLDIILDKLEACAEQLGELAGKSASRSISADWTSLCPQARATFRGRARRSRSAAGRGRALRQTREHGQTPSIGNRSSVAAAARSCCFPAYCTRSTVV